MTKQNKQYLRFSGFRRFQHWINTVSFLTLGFTGLIQKFNQAPFSLFFLEQLGGIEMVRIIHRVSTSDNTSCLTDLFRPAAQDVSCQGRRKV